MLIRMQDENWDLTPEQHLARAEELLSVVPVAGSVIEHEMQRTAVAGRHAVWGLIKTGRRTIGSHIGSDNLNSEEGLT